MNDLSNDPNILWALGVITTVYGSFALLLFYIWNKKDKRDEERFKALEGVMKTMADNQRDLTMLVTRLEVNQEHHKEDIKVLKGKL